jgi:hypothetical protein
VAGDNCIMRNSLSLPITRYWVIQSEEHRQGYREHLIEKRNSHKILIGRSEKKVAHGRARHRWDDNIKVKLFLSQIIF